MHNKALTAQKLTQGLKQRLRRYKGTESQLGVQNNTIFNNNLVIFGNTSLGQRTFYQYFYQILDILLNIILNNLKIVSNCHFLGMLSHH